MNNSINQPTDSDVVVGLSPSLPRPLSRSSWWTTPVKAELPAVLRIGVAAVLLFDQLTTMLPHLKSLYGGGSMGDPGLFAWMFQRPLLHWSLLQGIADPQAIQLAFWVWVAATVGLLVGWNTRLCAVLVWILAISFTNLNIYAINAGDHIRGMLLLYLMLVPCGATWSVDALLRRRHSDEPRRRLMVHPWALRLIMVQLAWMYCASGLCKLSGDSWPSGDSLYYVLHDVSLTRFSAAQLPLPLWLLQLSTWAVLVWEIAFPLLVFFRRTRVWALLFGVSLHLGIFISMELGGFPLYLLAAYAMLLLDLWYSRSVAKENRTPRFNTAIETAQPALAVTAA